LGSNPYGPMFEDFSFRWQCREYFSANSTSTPFPGFYSFRNRWYDPTSGRFLSKDPIGLDGGDLNLYVFCGNDPVNNVDPYGLQKVITQAELYGNKTRNGDIKNPPIDIGNNPNNMSNTPVGGITTGGAKGGGGVNTALNANNMARGNIAAAKNAVVTGKSPANKKTTETTTVTPPPPDCPPESPVVDVTKLTLTQTVESHITSRPYINSPLLAQEIMAVKPPIPDPQGIPGVLRWDVLGSFNNSKGTWELVVDPNKNQVLHWLFQSK